MTSQPGEETIVILPSTLRSKGNQTMKFGYLVERKNCTQIALNKLV